LQARLQVKEQLVAKGRSFFSRGRKVQTTHRYVTELIEHGLIMQRAGSGDGPEWVVDGEALRNFGSCSYMGLERHPALLAGAQEALHQYGSNFSISRAYLQCPLYDALEETLERVMGGRPVIVTPSTTMAHLSALPVLVGDRDLVLVDQFVHSSVHMATDLIDDVPIELVRHNRVDALEQKLIEAGDRYERVWYMCDGVYSMLGDFAPFAGLADLLARYPRLHLYVDDAHAMSWAGQHGRGAALSHLDSDRVVVAVSLSKAFGATGGAIILPNEGMRARVRRGGGPLMFSGPIPPAGLGAALASAKLHLSDAFATMQGELLDRISFTRAGLSNAGLTMATDDATPIFMIQYDSSPTAVSTVQALRARGFFCCVSTFPAVPMNKPSIRFTVSRHNAYSDIEALIEQLVQVSFGSEGAVA
jgi:7-keto-8-aminopelargonate synthetase-like enzyme